MKHINLYQRTCLFALFCVSCVNDCTAAELPSAVQLQALGLEARWESQAVLNVHKDRVTFSTNDEENVYVQSSGGVLTVFHAENGTKRWFAQVGNAGETAKAAVSNENVVVVVTGPVAYGFNKFDGTPLFEHRFPNQPSARAAIDEGTLYVPLSDGSLYAYSLSVLQYRYRYGKLPDTVAKSYTWRFICNEPILFAPVIGDRAVAFVTEAGSLHAVATSGLSRGRSRFQLILEEPATAPLGIIPNDTSSSVIMLTGSNQIFSVDLLRGSTEWTYPMGRPMTQAPQVVDNEVLVLTESGVATKLSRDDKSVHWGRPIEVPRYVSPSLIGAAMRDSEVDELTQESLRLPSSVMPQVTEVVPGGAAHVAGIQAGDRIVSIDDTDIGLTEHAQEQIGMIPLRVEKPIEVLRVSIGASLDAVQTLATPVNITEDVSAGVGIRLRSVVRESAAASSGLKEDDIMISIDDTPVTTRSAALLQIAAAAPGRISVKVIRGSQFMKADLELSSIADDDGKAAAGSAFTVERLGIRIPVRDWEAYGLKNLTTLGRFGIYGIDVTNRLVAFDRVTGSLTGRLAVTEYMVPHRNLVTDQIYLATESGEIACLREIGATTKVPELSLTTRSAKLTKMAVTAGDVVVSGETVVCELQLPDGSTRAVTATASGVVRTVFVAVSDTVYVGDSLLQIAEDAFATYHRRPGDRPIAVEAGEVATEDK